MESKNNNQEPPWNPDFIAALHKENFCLNIFLGIHLPRNSLDLSAPKSQNATATIFLRKGQIARKFCRKGAIFAWNSQNEIVISSDGNFAALNRSVSLFKSVQEIAVISGPRWKFTIAIARIARFQCTQVWIFGLCDYFI